MIQLDVDSFFIFSRILLDRLPFLLFPFFQGIVTRSGKTPDKRGFKAHLEWFEKKQKLVIDKNYLKEMISFKNWAEPNLFDFRDNIIVHSRRFQITSRIIEGGELERISFDPSTEKKITYHMPNIENVFKNIIRFLNYLDDYFSSNLK